jgi:hypothetical protein
MSARGFINRRFGRPGSAQRMFLWAAVAALAWALSVWGALVYLALVWLPDNYS